MKNEIYPCLWFDGKAKEAAEFYCFVFKNSVITAENQMVVTFEVSGRKFMCLNGGPQFNMNPSVSFYVVFEDEDELNNTWSKLIKDGNVLMPLDKYEWSNRYGWLQDHFGVSWQLAHGKISDVGQKIAPVLMFTQNQNGNAEKAVRFYTSVFENSSITGILKYSKEDGDVEGNVKHAQFKLNGNVFMALESSLSHNFGFNEAISFVVECDDQQEIDYFWKKLTDGGSEQQCGWLKDRFGVSWQVIPSFLEKLISDPSRSQRVINAFLQMKKFDIEALVNA